MRCGYVNSASILYGMLVCVVLDTGITAGSEEGKVGKG